VGFWGEDDNIVDLDSVMEWEKHTTGDFEFKHFPGSHLFLHANESEDELLDEVYDILANYIK
jgi:surfactin synthase thioesterase subunit